MAARTPKVSYWQDAPMPRDQLVLFATTLEERIPEAHPVRLLDEILDEMDWSGWEAKYVGHSGQPPIHPSVLCKVLLYALSRRIRSSRQIEYSVNHSIDFIWLVSGRNLDHTTISEFRRKYGAELKDIYRQMIKLAISLGVAKLSELCIDGTKIQANASRLKTFKRESLQQLISGLDAQISEAMAQMEAQDSLDDLFEDGQSAEQLPPELREVEERRAKLQEVLSQLEQMEQHRQRSGICPEKNPAQLPKNDLDSRILPNKEGGYAPNYTPMALTETCSGLIVGEDVLIGNVEHSSAIPMVQEIVSTYGIQTETLLADGAYATGANLTEAEAIDLELLAPLGPELAPEDNPAYREDLTQPVAEEDIARLPINPKTKRFDSTAFVYDSQTDTYHCPAGKTLRREGSVEKVFIGGAEVERQNYRCHDCQGCPLLSLCRTKETAIRGRKVGHDQFREIRQRHTARMRKPEVKERIKKRQHFGETQFAFIKANLGMRRFLLRGHPKVQIEWRWACLTHNLKKLMSLYAERCAPSNPQSTVAGL